MVYISVCSQFFSQRSHLHFSFFKGEGAQPGNNDSDATPSAGGNTIGQGLVNLSL